MKRVAAAKWGGSIEDHPEIGNDPQRPYALISREKGSLLTLLRKSDGHIFRARINHFLNGTRPPLRLLYQNEAVAGGEYKVVREDDLQLSQGSGKKVDFVRCADDYPFTMVCGSFCGGHRPPAQILRDLSPIREGRIQLVNPSDGLLGQGSNRVIEVRRPDSAESFTIPVHSLCSSLCFTCLKPHASCTFAPNTCSGCWRSANPAHALANAPRRKTEILVRTMLNEHLGTSSPCAYKIKQEVTTRDGKREDLVVCSTDDRGLEVAVAIDGVHHFRSGNAYGNRGTDSTAVQAVDTDKCGWWLADHPGSSYIRMDQERVFQGYPIPAGRKITFDFVNAIQHVLDRRDLFGGRVVFLERSDLAHKYGGYVAHREMLDARSIPHATLDPLSTDIPAVHTEDRRAVLADLAVSLPARAHGRKRKAPDTETGADIPAPVPKRARAGHPYAGRRAAPRWSGPVEEHPEVGDGPDRAYRLVKVETRKMGKGSYVRFVTMVRKSDGHEFTMRAPDFRRGTRPPALMLYQCPGIANGEFRLEDAEDGALGQGSARAVGLVRASDGLRFRMQCFAFCRGTRPPRPATMNV